MASFNKQARILRGKERIDHLIDKGLCEKCGEIRVMKIEWVRSFGRRIKKKTPITDKEVYKGRHILCHGGHETLIRVLKRRNEDVTELEKMWEDEKKTRLATLRQRKEQRRKERYQNSRESPMEGSEELSQTEEISANMSNSFGLQDSFGSFNQSSTAASRSYHSRNGRSEPSPYEIFNRSNAQEARPKDNIKTSKKSLTNDAYEEALILKREKFGIQDDQKHQQQKILQQQQQQKQQQQQLFLEQQQQQQLILEQQQQQQLILEQQLEQQRVIEEQKRLIQEQQEKILEQQQQKQQQYRAPFPEIYLDLDNNTIVSELLEDDTLFQKKFVRQSNVVKDVEKPPPLEERVPTTDLHEIALEDLEKNKTNSEKILDNLNKYSKRCGLSLVYPAYEHLLKDTVSFRLHKSSGISTLKDILLRYYYTHKNITIHTLDILIKCAIDCHENEPAWNDLVFSVFNKVIPRNLQNIDVLVRACTLIGCVFMSYSVRGIQSTDDSFTAQEGILDEICQTHISNEHVLEAASTTWIYLTLYDKPNEPRHPQWIEVALNKFPQNEHLWNCITILCKNIKSTPKTMGWIKEILIQNFPIENWSKTQAWCLYNASIHSKKSHILSPTLFHNTMASLVDEGREDTVMNILNLLNSEQTISSPILEQNIIKIMERFSENLGLQEAACTVLAHVEILSPEETTEPVLMHIKRNGLQTAASYALQTFLKSSAAKNPACRFILIRLTGILKDLISTHHSRKAASLLWTMCCYNETMGHAESIANSCGEIIISMSLTNHTGDDQILGLLGYLINADPGSMEKHLNDKVNDVITEVLRLMKSASDPDLVELACNIIASLSSNNVWKLFLLERNDLFSTLIPCIDKYEGPLKYDVFQIISNLAIQPEDIVSILNYDTLNHILNSLSDVQVVSEDDEEIKALDALSAILPCTMPHLLVNGTVLADSIVGILNRHIKEERVSRSCMLIIYNLIYNVKTDSGSEKFKSIFVREGAAILILSAMSEHLGSEDVQEKGCTILWSMVDDGYLKSIIAEENRLNNILISMQCHLKCIPLQEAGLGIIASISHIPVFRNIISSNRGIDVVLTILWVNIEQETIIIKGLVSLSNMVVNSETNEIDVVGPQELEMITAAMMSFPDSSEVQLSACRVLRNLSLAEENIKIMSDRSEQLLNLLTQAASKFPADCGERVDFIFGRIYGF